jgi:carbon-monoxide dehydrogenase catalytic subunit
MTKWSEKKITKSADKKLEVFIEGLQVNTAFHRVETQIMKCGFGTGGVCCKLCANGPCRITQDAPRGVCGATADVIAARNFLRAVAAGSGCYIHIVENAALNLRSIALAKGELRGKKALARLSKQFGIKGKDDHDTAVKIADAVLADLYKPDYEIMEITKKMAYAPRYKRWEELGILPGGAKAEVFSGVVKTSTNLNSDPVHMLFQCLRLGISTDMSS